MRNNIGVIKFWQVLPSSLTFLFVGAGAFWLYPTWTWFGELGFSAIVLGCILGVAMYASAFLIFRTPQLRSATMELVMQNLRAMFLHFTWPQIIVLSALAGLGEELLLRGLLQVWLYAEVGPWLAIFIASLIFGLMHFMNLTYVIITFVAGVILGMAFYFSSSLILVVAAHAVYDVCAFSMIVKFPHMLGLQSSHGFNHSRPKTRR